MLPAELLVIVVASYLAAGLIFSVPFLLLGVSRIDPGAEGAGIGFRLLILPGTALFWPLLGYRWWHGERVPPVEKNSHRIRPPQENQP